MRLGPLLATHKNGAAVSSSAVRATRSSRPGSASRDMSENGRTTPMAGAGDERVSFPNVNQTRFRPRDRDRSESDEFGEETYARRAPRAVTSHARWPFTAMCRSRPPACPRHSATPRPTRSSVAEREGSPDGRRSSASSADPGGPVDNLGWGCVSPVDPAGDYRRCPAVRPAGRCRATGRSQRQRWRAQNPSSPTRCRGPTATGWWSSCRRGRSPAGSKSCYRWSSPSRPMCPTPSISWSHSRSSRPPMMMRWWPTWRRSLRPAQARGWRWRWS